MLHVFLPLKDLAWAKTRLAGLLSDEQRETLVEAMALDVVDAVLAAGSDTRLSVIAPGCWQGRLPQCPDLNLLREEQLASTGLNGVLREAVAIEQPDRALVLHGDLPGLAAQDIRAAARTLRDHDVVICPDAAGVGTNALGFRFDAMPAFYFGPDSFAAHQRCADAGSGPWTVLDRPGLTLDIDTPADLGALLRRAASGAPVGARTALWATRHGPALLKSLGRPSQTPPSVGSQGQTPALAQTPTLAQSPALAETPAAMRSAADPEPQGVPL